MQQTISPVLSLPWNTHPQEVIIMNSVIKFFCRFSPFQWLSIFCQARNVYKGVLSSDPREQEQLPMIMIGLPVGTRIPGSR